ncbi:MAG: 6-pyruvoyl tetrahydropterin synthase family protein [Actinomycetota bacterium]
MRYEVGTAVSLHALHRMPVEGPEGELHEHEYRLEVVVARDDLDAQGMVVDLERLDDDLEAVRSELEGNDLEAIRPTDAEAVTVEVFARWVHERLAPTIRHSGGGELLVRVYESPVAFGGYRATVS